MSRVTVRPDRSGAPSPLKGQTVEEKRLLYSKEIIDKRVKTMAETISRDLEGKEVVLIGVLKGAFIFLADLARYLKIPHTVDFVRLASYGSGSTSSGTITITKDIETDIEGKEVVIVEDIIDTGASIAFLQERLQEQRPGSIKVCALIDKKQRRKRVVNADYVGFTLGEGFIVGYGLDFDERFRCLPEIYVIKEGNRDYSM
ncbi:MAG: hypoxanthine phosphoribosyltransferase [Syntrophobacterales bacterium]|nr:MAG: hypoxanthine phosphoribosyltransferase [Syntrophobacterales bacterium]